MTFAPRSPVEARRAELWGVGRAVFFLLYAAGLVVSADAQGRPSVETATVAAYERRFQDLPFDEQRMVRSLAECAVEAERARSERGAWPEVAALAKAEVPPFARDPLDRAGYTWRYLGRPGLANYVGTPKDPAAPALFLILAEPDPGTPIDPTAKVDDVHHRLADGTMIHVTLWAGRPLTLQAPVTLLPPEEGYVQIIMR